MNRTIFIYATVILSVLLLWPLSPKAQEKKFQGGFRLGTTSGFTGRVITNEAYAFEGILGFRSGGAQIYGLLEKRKMLVFPRTDNFSLYYGGGAHIGVVGWHKYYAYEYKDDKKLFLIFFIKPDIYLSCLVFLH